MQRGYWKFLGTTKKEMSFLFPKWYLLIETIIKLIKWPRSVLVV